MRFIEVERANEAKVELFWLVRSLIRLWTLVCRHERQTSQLSWAWQLIGSQSQMLDKARTPVEACTDYGLLLRASCKVGPAKLNKIPTTTWHSLFLPLPSLSLHPLAQQIAIRSFHTETHLPRLCVSASNNSRFGRKSPDVSILELAETRRHRSTAADLWHLGPLCGHQPCLSLNPFILASSLRNQVCISRPPWMKI